MFVDADIMDKDDQDDLFSAYPDHWVTLTSSISDGGLFAYDSPIALTVFSWGDGAYDIPQKPPLAKKYFIYKFYGYIAVKK
jgi:hypothetical protein